MSTMTEDLTKESVQGLWYLIRCFENDLEEMSKAYLKANVTGDPDLMDTLVRNMEDVAEELERVKDELKARPK